jgi:hypothetical protein
VAEGLDVDGGAVLRFENPGVHEVLVARAAQLGCVLESVHYERRP